MESRAPSELTQPLLLADGAPAADAWGLDAHHLHLNHASYGAVPRSVLERQAQLRRTMEEAPVRWFAQLPGAMSAARERVTASLGAGADELALVLNATAGATAVFRSVSDSAAGGTRRDVVVTDHGYGAVSMGAARLAARLGGRLRVASVPLGADEDEAAGLILEHVDEGVALVVVDQITSPTARRMPVARVARAAAALGVPTLVDGAHAPALLPHPLDAQEVAYWVGNLHKYACAPRGAAALVARGLYRDGLFPVVDSWGSPDPYPRRFDAQGTMDATAWLLADAGLEQLEVLWGWERVRRYSAELAAYAVGVVASALTAATGEDHRPDVGMAVEQIRLVRLPSGLVEGPAAAHRLRDRLLAEAHVEAAITDFGGVGYLRLSPHAYNTASEYEEFAERVVPLLVRWAGEGL